MAFSAADLTILRIRCSGCGQHTEKLVTVLVRKSNIPCNVCGSLIDLDTPMNRLLIKETAQNCARIGAALLAQVATSAPPVSTSPSPGLPQADDRRA
jgi:hypothetical protein